MKFARILLPLSLMSLASNPSWASECAVDTSFDAGSNSWVSDINILENDQVLISGLFTQVDGQSRSNLARLNADGTLDDSFILDSDIVSTSGTPIPLQDEKIISGANYIDDNNMFQSAVLRMNPDGQIDTSFEPIPDFFSAALDDGTFLTRFLNNTEYRLRRYSLNGTRDMNFDLVLGGGARVIDAQIQSDGKIVIIGSFSSVDGVVRSSIARLNVDGTLDLGFDPNLTITDVSFGVEEIEIDNHDRILIAGNFSHVGGVAKQNFARLNADGSLDDSFMLEIESASNEIEVDENNNIYLGGRFRQGSIVTDHGVHLFTEQGVLVDAFSYSVDDRAIFDLALVNTDSLLVSGSFDNNGSDPDFLVKISRDCIGSVEFDFSSNTVQKTEKDTGEVTIFEFPIERLNDLNSEDWLEYEVISSSVNSADEGDFSGTLPSGRLEFEVGESLKNIVISVTGDFLIENEERFEVKVNIISRGTISNMSATGIILNNDVGDTDGDNIANLGDNCPDMPNQQQEDQDNDGIGDLCDLDVDGDSVNDIFDNCPATNNPSQSDIDGDGFGDVCDDDDDGDFIPDSDDNCPLVENTDQLDENGFKDGTGYGDACEKTLEDLCVPIKLNNGSLALICL